MATAVWMDLWPRVVQVAAASMRSGEWKGLQGLGLCITRIPGRRVWQESADSGSLDPELGKKVGPRGGPRKGACLASRPLCCEALWLTRPLFEIPLHASREGKSHFS